MRDMTKTTETKTVYRLPPCPGYDMERLETWLTDLAAEGLYLKKEGFFIGIGAFERGMPRPVRYRLEPSAASTGMWSSNYGEPSPEAIAISEEFGWEYVDKYGEFHIYRTFDRDARELSTDSAVEAMTLKKVRGRQIDALVRNIFWFLLYPALIMRGSMVVLALKLGFFITLLGTVMVLSLAVSSFLRLRYFTRLRRRLLDGDDLHQRREWRNRHRRFRFFRTADIALSLLFLALLGHAWAVDTLGSREIPLADYTGPVPFSTVVDLAPDKEGEYRENRILDIYSHVVNWSDPLAPVNVDWEEFATISYPDGTELDVTLYAEYHELAHPILARLLRREFQEADKRSHFFSKPNRHYQKLPAPELDVDYIAAYRSWIGFETIVLQEENKIMHISYVQHSDTDEAYRLTLEEWAGVFAEDIKQ